MPPRPASARHQNTVALSLSLHSHVRRLSPQVLRPLRTRNRAVGATLVHPGLHRYVSPRSRLTSSHSETPLASTLSLSGSEDKNLRTPPLVQPCARSHLGDVAWFILFYPIPNLRAASIFTIYSQNRLDILHPRTVCQVQMGLNSRCHRRQVV